MSCYFCEEPLGGGSWYVFDTGKGVCGQCLAQVGLWELLELTGASSLVRLLIRYNIATVRQEGR